MRRLCGGFSDRLGQGHSTQARARAAVIHCAALGEHGRARHVFERTGGLRQCHLIVLNREMGFHFSDEQCRASDRLR
jgi:hypothetical protein